LLCGEWLPKRHVLRPWVSCEFGITVLSCNKCKISFLHVNWYKKN
jgi:hypothetical protein